MISILPVLNIERPCAYDWNKPINMLKRLYISYSRSAASEIAYTINDFFLKKFPPKAASTIHVFFSFLVYISHHAPIYFTATVLPERPTLTVHVGEDVLIAVVTNMTKGDLQWRFNGAKMFGSNGKQFIFLENVQLNQAGVYKCFAEKKWDAENAIFLLHVISKLIAYLSVHVSYIFSLFQSNFHFQHDRWTCNKSNYNSTLLLLAKYQWN